MEYLVNSSVTKQLQGKVKTVTWNVFDERDYLANRVSSLKKELRLTLITSNSREKIIISRIEEIEKNVESTASKSKAKIEAELDSSKNTIEQLRSDNHVLNGRCSMLKIELQNSKSELRVIDIRNSQKQEILETERRHSEIVKLIKDKHAKKKLTRYCSTIFSTREAKMNRASSLERNEKDQRATR
jgi:hypothetical protein